MKTITIPEDVTIKDLQGNPQGQLEFLTFLENRLEDAVFGKDSKTVLAQVRILSAIQNANGKGEIGIEDSDYPLLVQAVENPTTPYNPRVVASFLPSFLEALKGAE